MTIRPRRSLASLPSANRLLSARLVALLGFATFVALPGPVHAADAPATARYHMAATASPLATQAALAVLREGGSAVDAAIAAQMMLAVVEPQSSGLGGGSLLMVWEARTKRLTFIDGLASAPAMMPEDYAHEAGGGAIDPKTLDRSGRVVAVPGTLRTLAVLHTTQGRLPWARLFQDAIATAENGFPLPPYLHATLLSRKDLAGKPGLAAYFGPDGKALPAGSPIHNLALAATLRRVAKEGPDALYAGIVADDMVAAVGQAPYPGTLTLADLAAYRPHERTPVCADAFQHRICSAAPPSSGGVALLQQLAVLDRVHIADQLPGSVASAHLFIEAARLAEADRRAYIGDPDQVEIPLAGLLDPSYLDARAHLIGPTALETASHGTPLARHAALPASDPLEMSATSHLAIVDDAGNAVSFTTTINLNFGSDIVVDGVVLNDALTNFATRPVVNGVHAANAAAPNKRPITTMAPAIVFDADGRPVLIVGAGGGARIIDSVAETIVGVLAWHQQVREAIEQPRIGGENNAQELERDTPAAGLADALRALGHKPVITEMNGGVQAIAILPGGGLEGWADPRRDGVALGD